MYQAYGCGFDQRQATKTSFRRNAGDEARRNMSSSALGVALVTVLVLVLLAFFARVAWQGRQDHSGWRPFAVFLGLGGLVVFAAGRCAKKTIDYSVVGGQPGPMEQQKTTTDQRLLFGAVRKYPETKKRTLKFIRSKLPREVAEPASRLVCSGAPDISILGQMRGLIDALQKEESGAAKADGRAKSRLDDVVPELAMFRARVSPEFRYLDVGSSEGHITGAVAEELGLTKAQAFACDIVEPATKDKRFTFARNTATKLPFDDATFDVLTLFMSAHHFVDVGAMLGECRRVTRPGALVLIREHDCATPVAAAFYDITHAVYACVLGREATPEEFLAQYATGTYAHYRAKADWIKLFAAHDFVLSDKIEPHASRYGVDSFDSFYALFVRKN